MIQAPLMVWSKLDYWPNFGEQFASIIFTALVIVTICLIYNSKIRTFDKEHGRMGGFLVLIEMFVTSCENLVVNSMGKKYRKLTPYAMYIISYIFIGSVISLIGIESLTTSYTVPLAMGLVTFICIYYFGFKYQKLSYFKRYKNPLEILTQFAPLVSISFRLFGNLLGGSIILGLVYALFIGVQSDFAGMGNHVGMIFNDTYDEYKGFVTNEFQQGANQAAHTWQAQYEYFWTGFNVFTTFITPWLHMYFDLFDAGIQAIVFTMLTLSYWEEAMGEGNEGKEPEKRGSELKNDKKNAEKTAKHENAIQVAL